MTKHQSIDTPTRDDNFYETMPMYARPHSIYQDDVDEYQSEYSQEQIDRLSEHMQISSRLTALIALAVVVLLGIGLILLVMYGLSIISDSAAPAAGLSSGSLEL